MGKYYQNCTNLICMQLFRDRAVQAWTEAGRHTHVTGGGWGEISLRFQTCMSGDDYWIWKNMLCFTKYSPHQLFLCHEGFQRAFIKCTNDQDTVERTNRTINSTTYYVSVALFYSAHVLSLIRTVISQAFFLHFTDEDTIQKAYTACLRPHRQWVPVRVQTQFTLALNISAFPGACRGLPGKWGAGRSHFLSWPLCVFQRVDWTLTRCTQACQVEEMWPQIETLQFWTESCF